VVGYRLIRKKNLAGRSACPRCKTTLAWYDLVPVLSWIVLRGQCRTCKKPISLLYPFIELLTATLTVLIATRINTEYQLGYFIFFSALIVTIRTDFERMLISRYMTWCMIPVAFALCLTGHLPLTLQASILGAAGGYAILWLIAYLFYRFRKIQGLGAGDLDLLGMIGAFIGLKGAWMSLFLGAFLGTLAGIFIILKTKKQKFPFGPWLAAGAIIYVLAKYSIDQVLF
jgi:leader peptidase (prepilin peptidase) / N-methyltransferase